MSNKEEIEEIKENFLFAVDSIKNSQSNNPGMKGPTDQERLKFYSLYKQATIGKCNTQQPWAINVVDRAKWDAWNSLGNMKKQDAMIKYCELFLDIRQISLKSEMKES